MAKFTQLGLSGEPSKKSDAKTTGASAPSRHGISEKQKTTAFVGTVVVAAVAGIFLLQTGGCSREDTKPVASSPANVMFNPAPAPALLGAPTTPAPTVASPPKKVVKPRPSTVTYSDPNYGVSFRYPRKYTLQGSDNTEHTADSSEQVAMNFVQPGGVSVAKVEVPKGTFPGTDLAFAAFNLNVNKSLTEDECYQFALPGADGPDSTAVSPSKVKLGVMEFQEIENLTGPVTKQSDAKYYHVYDNAACYEFALGLATEDGSEEELTPVNREEVFQKLEKILASVKIKPHAATEQTASAPATVPSEFTGTAK